MKARIQCTNDASEATRRSAAANSALKSAALHTDAFSALNARESHGLVDPATNASMHRAARLTR